MFIDNERTRTGRATVTRAHAAALLRKVRRQRDAWRIRAQQESKIAQVWEGSYYKQTDRLAEADAAREQAIRAAKQLEAVYNAECEARRNADAAREAALQVAERESAKAKAAQAEEEKLAAALSKLISCAPGPEFKWSAYAEVYEETRKLLAERKERA